MYHKNLYSMWKDAWERKILPQEWLFADDFLTWATQNGYKVEFGYDGDFTPENCLAATPVEHKSVITSDDYESGSGKTTYVLPEKITVEDLVKGYKLTELKQFASDLSLDIGTADTKREIAEIIIAKSTKPLDIASEGE